MQKLVAEAEPRQFQPHAQLSSAVLPSCCEPAACCPKAGEPGSNCLCNDQAERLCVSLLGLVGLAAPFEALKVLRATARGGNTASAEETQVFGLLRLVQSLTASGPLFCLMMFCFTWEGYREILHDWQQMWAILLCTAVSFASYVAGVVNFLVSPATQEGHGVLRVLMQHTYDEMPRIAAAPSTFRRSQFKEKFAKLLNLSATLKASEAEDATCIGVRPRRRACTCI